MSEFTHGLSNACIVLVQTRDVCEGIHIDDLETAGRLGRLSFPRCHSALTPTSLIIGHHFSIWDFCNARKRLRRPLLGWENLAPRSARRDRSTGSANAWSVAAWSRSTVSFGVPFGAKSAHQVEKESFGSPSRRRSGCRAPGPAVTVRRPGARMAPASSTRACDQVGWVNRSAKTASRL